MKKYSNGYFIKIKPELLFDTKKVFKSNYTPWVYLNLRLKYNVMLQKAPNKMYEIDVVGIADILGTHPDTIYESIKELRNVNLIEKRGIKYRLLPDTNYISNVNTENRNFNYPKSYVRIFHNYHFNLLDTIRDYIPKDKKTRGFLSKILSVYYYLTASNRQCLLPTPVVKSDKTQTSLSRELFYDHRDVKTFLSILKSTGYIKYNAKNEILTIDKDLYVEKPAKIECNDNIVQNNFYNYEESQVVPAKVEPIKVEEPKVPKNFIGFSKSTDGSKIMCIYYDSNIKERTLFVYCDGDGTPFTGDDYERYTDLMQNGKSSKFYDPNNYWKYQSARKAFVEKNSKKAA